jgi:hypothetical protein
MDQIELIVGQEHIIELSFDIRKDFLGQIDSVVYLKINPVLQLLLHILLLLFE